MYKLYAKQKIFKITDHYEIFDKNQNPIYKVDQDFKLFGNTVHVKKFDGSKYFVIDKEILTWLPKFTVEFNDGKSFIIKQNFNFFRKDIDIISDYYDIKLMGNFWDLDFEVYDKGVLVGIISQELFALSDTFVIEVIDENYEEELVALFITVDHIKDMQQK